MAVAFIALGGNLGAVQQTFFNARKGLEDCAGLVVASSRLYVTAPLQVTRATSSEETPNNYLNAVCRLETQLTPWALLHVLFDLERRAGRVRTTRWASRTLDLDLLAYDKTLSKDPALTLPHPAAGSRPFVLQPWCDVGADWPLPPNGVTPRRLRDALVHAWSGILAVKPRW